MKTNSKAAVMLLVLVTLFFSPVDAATRLTILHTNDTHSRMLPFEQKYFAFLTAAVSCAVPV